jgi:ribosome-associated toxin RatA of RatAB toxin-antitoxin module
MSQITIKKTIQADPAHIWSILADVGGVHRFHPAVESSPLLNGQATGLGAQRACHFYDGASIKEEVTGFEEGSLIAVDVTEISAPIEGLRGTFRVAGIGEGRTQVTIDMDYQPKYGPVGALMNAAMIRPQFRKVLGKVLDGLEVHATTGAYVGKDGRVEPAESSLAA